LKHVHGALPQKRHAFSATNCDPVVRLDCSHLAVTLQGPDLQWLVGGKDVYKKILIATDGSDLASAGVEHGLGVAKAVGAHVLIVTVTEPWSSLAMASEADLGNHDAIPSYAAAAATSAAGILEAAASKAADVGVPCDTLHVPDQRPAEAILKTAQEQSCDLIVMASHGRRGIGRILLGSQTAEVLAHAKTPVLVLR
jgi:nucleotide-binding universal stress UspA family protein